MIEQLIERVRQIGPISECVLFEAGAPVYSMRAMTAMAPGALKLPIRGWVRINGTIYTVGSFVTPAEIGDVPIDLCQPEPEDVDRFAQLLLVKRYGKEIDLSD